MSTLPDQIEALVEVAQDVDAAEVGDGRNPLGHQARRDHQLVVAQLAAVGQRDLLTRRVEGGRTRAEQHGDVVLLVELRGFERDVVGLAAQHFLRQGRAVVRQMVLVADDGDRAGIVRTPQLLGGAGRCETAADDHDAT